MPRRRRQGVFWIGDARQGGPVHVAFVAQARAQVDAFYQAALAAGYAACLARSLTGSAASTR
jgi:hypothetical protein